LPSQRGVDVLLDFLEANQFKYVFGNPGTFEQSFMEALSHRRHLKYVLALHESVAVAMADGYARASGQPAFVNVHVSAGLANGLSQIYNAMAHRSPLLISAGQAESNMLIEEPLLAADSVSLASHFTKWAWELRHPSDVPTALRRALKVAISAPPGPVFLSLPIDLLELPTHSVEAPRRHQFRPHTAPPDGNAIQGAATILLEATRPVILCGDDVGRSGAMPELVGLAEALGASVYALAQCEVSFPNDHPQFVRTLNPSAPASRDHIANADAVVAVGTPLLQQLLSPRTAILPAGATVVHIVESDWEADKNVPTDVALVGTLASSLRALRAAVEDAMSAADVTEIARRRAAAQTKKQAQLTRLADRIRSSEASAHIGELRLMSALRSVLPDEFTVVEEAPSASSAIQQAFMFSRPKTLFGNRGAALGWGMPAALGVQLAIPQGTVVAVIGDGAANYSIQALWTAAHYQLPVKFLICNNREYRVLRTNLAEFLPGADLRGLVGMDLTHPDIDYVELARGYGVPGRRIEDPHRLQDDLAEAVREPGPALVEVVITRSTDGT
jgi:benzoylformate decarboxylase